MHMVITENHTEPKEEWKVWEREKQIKRKKQMH
jgi:hypothetical protein